MYEHFVVEHLLLQLCSSSTASAAQHRTKPQSKYVPIKVRQRKQTDTVLQYRKHSTHRSAISPHTQPSEYVPIRARQRKQADNKVGASQHIYVVEHLYCALSSQNEYL